MQCLKTLVRNQKEAMKSPFKLEFFTEPLSQYRINTLQLRPKKSKAWHGVLQEFFKFAKDQKDSE